MPKKPVIPFPFIDIDDAVQISDRIVKEFKGSIKIQGLARALGMSERGGGFLSKAAALRDYGLIEGRGDLRSSDLAQRIAYPSPPEERNSSKREAFLRVELFSLLAERIGTAVPEEDRFSIFVEEITNASRIEVARSLGRLRRVYAEGAKYLTENASVATNIEASESPSNEPQFAPPGAAEKGVIELRTSDMQLRLPRTKPSIELLISALNSLKESIADDAESSDDPVDM